MRYKPTDLAWAAGFLDGEGCFSIKVKNSKPHEPFIAAFQKATGEPIYKLQEMFGGAVRVISDGWEWRISGATSVRNALPLLIPYLVVKWTQADLLLSYCQSINPHNGGRPLEPLEIQRRLAVVSELKALR